MEMQEGSVGESWKTFFFPSKRKRYSWNHFCFLLYALKVHVMSGVTAVILWPRGNTHRVKQRIAKMLLLNQWQNVLFRFLHLGGYLQPLITDIEIEQNNKKINLFLYSALPICRVNSPWHKKFQTLMIFHNNKYILSILNLGKPLLKWNRHSFVLSFSHSKGTCKESISMDQALLEILEKKRPQNSESERGVFASESLITRNHYYCILWKSIQSPYK